MLISQLKEQVSFSDVNERFNLNLKQGGKYHCPTCGSSTAFKVKDNRRYHCYRCMESGDIIDLLQLMGIARNTGDALSKISREFGLRDLETYQPGLRRRLQILDFAFNCFKAEFYKSEVAQAYCHRRGWVKNEDVGFCPAGDFLQRQGLRLSELEEAGLAKSGLELMSNRVVFAIRSAGKIVHLSGRSLEELEGGDSLRWLSTKGSPSITNYVMNADCLSNDLGWALLTEGVSDTHSVMQLQRVPVIGTFGIHAPAELLLKHLRGKVNRICALYDSDRYALDGSDKAGLHKSWSVVLPELIQFSAQSGIQVWCFINEGSNGKDINDLLLDCGYEREAFLSRLNSSIPLSQLAYKYYANDKQKEHLLWRSLIVGYGESDQKIRQALWQQASPESIAQMLKEMK